MTRILHIHPDYKMAKIFVVPLIEKENLCGFKSHWIVFKSDVKNSKIKKINLFLFNIFLIKEIIRYIIYLKRYNPDIIISHNSLQSLIPLIFARLLKIKKIIYFNHGVTYLGYQGILKFLFKYIETINLKISDEIITVSKDMRNELKKITSNVSIIHNGSACGINLQPKRTLTKNNNIIIPCNKLIINYSGRLKKRKGLDLIINLIKHYKNDKAIFFILCGFTEKDLFKHVKSRYKNTKCFGFVDDINYFLQRSDITLLPSLHEGLPYVILESMLNKSLVIANNIPGIRSIVKNNYNGLLINNNDLNLYIKSIDEVKKNKLKFKKTLQNGVKTVRKYDRKTFLEKYINFLTKI